MGLIGTDPRPGLYAEHGYNANRPINIMLIRDRLARRKTVHILRILPPEIRRGRGAIGTHHLRIERTRANFCFSHLRRWRFYPREKHWKSSLTSGSAPASRQWPTSPALEPRAKKSAR